ncbi:MAG TPA: hypothetical protein PK230_07015 [Chitinophagales bacterium]|nr:hypothetical protein [Chitinophagales bacterium]
MKPISFFLFIVSSCLAVSSCKCHEDSYIPLYIQNNSDSDVYYYYSDKPLPAIDSSKESVKGHLLANDRKAKANNTTEIDIPCLLTWQEYYQNSDTLSFFILDAAAVEAPLSDSCIIKSILARYDLSYEDIEQMGFVLSYP